ncbi:MAG: hypothetical protein HC840_20570 [Leptolyngbyaceae cyanobacterium RM2_2_4]|nr:hypothetical protein [Leptolyngbyaceae cyanobacterium SM1_4_3]NJO51434.1 hypothetical protein [Leptolyngbyaceae cyanobacterium RM2_2_4]
MFKYKGIEAKEVSGSSAILYCLAQQSAIARHVKQVGGNFTSEIHISIFSGNYFAPIPAEVAKLSVLWVLLVVVTFSAPGVIASWLTYLNSLNIFCSDNCSAPESGFTSTPSEADASPPWSSRTQHGKHSDSEGGRSPDSKFSTSLEFEASCSSDLSSIGLIESACLYSTLSPMLCQSSSTYGISNSTIAQGFAISGIKLINGLDLPQLAQPMPPPLEGVTPLAEPEEGENSSEAHSSTSLSSGIQAFVPTVQPGMTSLMGNSQTDAVQGVDERLSPIGLLVFSLLTLFLLRREKRPFSQGISQGKKVQLRVF